MNLIRRDHRKIIIVLGLALLFGVARGGLADPATPDKPLPTAELFASADEIAMRDLLGKSAKALREKKYDELEEIADLLETSSEIWPSGHWKLDVFDELAEIQSNETEESAGEWVGHFRDWVAAKPDSPTARAALADALSSYAWYARGNGVSSTVSQEAWKSFRARLDEARTILREAKNLPQISPLWWSVAQKVALGQEWDRATYDGLVGQALAAHPNYETVYFYKLHFLQLRWYGDEGEWQEFATSSADAAGGEKGDIFYARLIWAADRLGALGSQNPNSGISTERLERGFTALSKLYPDNSRVLNEWARLTMLANDNNLSGKRMEHARELFLQIGSRADKSVWNNLANFEKWRDSAFDIPDYHQRAADKYQASDNEGALTDMSIALEKYSKRAELFNTRGLILNNMGRFDAASTDFKRAIALDINYYFTYVNDAKNSADKGDWQAAIKSAKLAMAYDPSQFDTQLVLARARFAADEAGAAREYALLQTTPKDLYGLFARANARSDLKDYRGALADLNVAIEHVPDRAALYSSRAFAFYRLQSWPESLKDFQKSLSLKQPNDTAKKSGDNTDYQHIYLWLIRTRMCQSAAATEELKKTFAAQPKSADEWTGKIVTFLTSPLSEDEFLAAVAAPLADKEDRRGTQRKVEANYFIAEKYLLNGNKTKAAEFFQKVLDFKRREITETENAAAQLEVLQNKP